MEVIELQTNKNEQFCLTNSKEHGIIILSCGSNLEVLCQTTNEIFVDGTFKFCLKYFEQLHLMVQFAKLQNGESDRQHFLKAIGFKFSARTDLYLTF